MWRKWWAPNNASKQQMGFNSALLVGSQHFKGLYWFCAWKSMELRRMPKLVTKWVQLPNNAASHPWRLVELSLVHVFMVSSLKFKNVLLCIVYIHFCSNMKFFCYCNGRNSCHELYTLAKHFHITLHLLLWCQLFPTVRGFIMVMSIFFNWYICGHNKFNTLHHCFPSFWRILYRDVFWPSLGHNLQNHKENTQVHIALYVYLRLWTQRDPRVFPWSIAQLLNDEITFIC